MWTWGQVNLEKHFWNIARLPSSPVSAAQRARALKTWRQEALEDFMVCCVFLEKEQPDIWNNEFEKKYFIFPVKPVKCSKHAGYFFEENFLMSPFRYDATVFCTCRR